MEQGPVQALHHDLSGSHKRLLLLQRRRVLDVVVAAVLLLLVGVAIVLAHELGDGEDGLALLVVLLAQAEARGRETALGPAVGDVGEVPVDRVGANVAVQLVADVDEGLDGGGVDVVDGGEVEDDGLEGRAGVFLVPEVARFGVVPRAVLLLLD